MVEGSLLARLALLALLALHAMLTKAEAHIACIIAQTVPWCDPSG